MRQCAYGTSPWYSNGPFNRFFAMCCLGDTVKSLYFFSLPAQWLGLPNHVAFWPLSTFAAAHQFGSDRRQSGSASDGCEPTLLDPLRKWRVRRSSRDKSDRSQVLVTYWTAQEAVRPRMM
jgi:hypothetical protein